MSTTVSNPYSFNIVNNTSFTAPSIAASLPSNDTALKFESTGNYGYFRTTIPDNVKVIKSIDGTYIGVTPNKIYEVYSIISGCIEGNGESGYIGTNKATWFRYMWGEDDGDYDEELNPNNHFYYSASINNHAIDVADY